MHDIPSDDIARDAARRRARIAALGEHIARLTERLTALQAERTRLILDIARAEQVLAWRARAGVAFGDIVADLEALDVAQSALIGAERAGDTLLLTFRLAAGQAVRIAFAASGADEHALQRYAERSVACEGIVPDGDGYRLLLVEGDALLSDGCLIPGDLLAVQRLSLGDAAA